MPDVLCPVVPFRVFVICALLRAKTRMPSNIIAQGRKVVLF